jgi:glycosyltransferase involved in cell wall biosynthesis
MATGKPVLAIDIKGNRAIIKNGYNGVLAKPTVQDLSKKLLLLLNDLDLSNKLGQNALKTIKEKHDSKLIANKFEELITTEIGLFKK